MGRKSRDKGARHERALVALMQEHGRAAEKMPLSGALGGRWAGDISVPVLGADWRVEAKVRARGFVELYRWLDGNDALIVQSDRHQPLVVLPLRRALEILHAVESAPASLVRRDAA